MKIININIICKLPDNLQESEYKALEYFINIYYNKPELLSINDNIKLTDIINNNNILGSIDYKFNNLSNNDIESLNAINNFINE